MLRRRSADVQVLVGLLRHYVTVLLNSAPKKQPAAAVREQLVGVLKGTSKVR